MMDPVIFHPRLYHKNHHDNMLDSKMQIQSHGAESILPDLKKSRNNDKFENTMLYYDSCLTQRYSAKEDDEYIGSNAKKQPKRPNSELGEYRDIDSQLMSRFTDKATATHLNVVQNTINESRLNKTIKENTILSHVDPKLEDNNDHIQVIEKQVDLEPQFDNYLQKFYRINKDIEEKIMEETRVSIEKKVIEQERLQIARIYQNLKDFPSPSSSPRRRLMNSRHKMVVRANGGSNTTYITNYTVPNSPIKQEFSKSNLKSNFSGLIQKLAIKNNKNNSILKSLYVKDKSQSIEKALKNKLNHYYEKTNNINQAKNETTFFIEPQCIEEESKKIYSLPNFSSYPFKKTYSTKSIQYPNSAKSNLVISPSKLVSLFRSQKNPNYITEDHNNKNFFHFKRLKSSNPNSLAKIETSERFIDKRIDQDTIIKSPDQKPLISPDQKPLISSSLIKKTKLQFFQEMQSNDTLFQVQKSQNYSLNFQSLDEMKESSKLLFNPKSFQNFYKKYNRKRQEVKEMKTKHEFNSPSRDNPVSLP